MEEGELTKALEPILNQLTKLIETVTEMVPGLLDNPVGLLILLFVVPTLFKFGFGIISAVFGFIADLVSGIFHIIYQIIISPFTIAKFIRHQRKHRSKEPVYDEEFGQKYGYEDEGEYQKIEFGKPPTTHKKAKTTTPDQDLAASLKTNLLDE